MLHLSKRLQGRAGARKSLTRRDWLQIGGLGMLGLTLPRLLAAEDAQQNATAGGRAGKAAGSARSCIVLWLAGGPAQPDMWDMKTEEGVIA
jgi:hypothetical protein